MVFSTNVSSNSNFKKCITIVVQSSQMSPQVQKLKNIHHYALHKYPFKLKNSKSTAIYMHPFFFPQYICLFIVKFIFGFYSLADGVDWHMSICFDSRVSLQFRTKPEKTKRKNQVDDDYRGEVDFFYAINMEITLNRCH